LIRKLGDKRFTERERAQKELAEMGEPALEPLRKAVASADQEVAARARICLPLVELNIKVAECLPGLRDPRLEVRLEAAQQLAKLRGPGWRKAVPDLMRALDDPDLKLRDLALIILAGIGEDSKPAVPKVIAILTDKQLSADLRWRAAQCLQYIGPAAEEAVPVLLRMLGTETGLPLMGAVNALGGIGSKDERVIPALIKLLADADPRIQFNAAAVLGQISKSPATVVPALVELLKKNPNDPNDKDVARYAERAGYRRAVIVALGRFGEAAEPAVPALLDIAKDSREEVPTREYAIKAIGRIGPKAKAAVPTLEALRKDLAVGLVLEKTLVSALEAINRPEN
jgi:HEAT repeat protein